mmetsp:Transcript_12088/g.19799  ORF Transcript_12088/g.19799 Transcript_12088/m.19799 type:complete len:197 (-) Transcript_12088:144-734(-)
MIEVTVRSLVAGLIVYGPEQHDSECCIGELQQLVTARSEDPLRAAVLLRGAERLDDIHVTLGALMEGSANTGVAAIDLATIWQFQSHPPCVMVSGAGSALVNGKYRREDKENGSVLYFHESGTLRLLYYTGVAKMWPAAWYLEEYPSQRAYYQAPAQDMQPGGDTPPLLFDGWEKYTGAMSKEAEEPAPTLTPLAA